MNCSFITNTAIAGSGYGTATGGGGAVFNLNGAVTLESVTYSGNTATTSGGTALPGAMFYNLSHNGGNTTVTATSNATLTLVDMTLSTTNGDLLNNEVNGTATVTTVASQPVASLSADGLAFGNQRLNVTTSAQTVTLTNTGTSPLTISSVVLAGSGYLFSNKTCGTMLNANASCAVSVTFEATTGGTLDGSITFTDNGYASTTQVVTLTGHGIAVTQLGFATAPPAVLTAGGNAGTISVQEDDANGSLDTYATDSITLAVTGPASYSATYTATASAGLASFDLSGAALSTGGTYTYTVSSTGLSSAIATGLVVQPSTTFGSVNVGSPTSPQLISVYMPNGADVASIAVLTQGFTPLDFTSTTGGTCATGTYTAGQTCTVNVIFTPSVAGARAGAVVLRDAGGNALATTLVYGTGTGAQIGFGAGVQTEPFNFNGSYPAYGFAFDTAGNIFYGNASNGTIMRAPLVSGVYGTAVSIGSGFNSPVSVQIDGAGNVYVAQSPYFTNGEPIPPNGGYGSVTEIPLTTSGYGTPVVVISQVATLEGAALAPSGTFYLSTGSNGLYQASLTATGYGSPTLLSSTAAQTSPVVDVSGNVYFGGSSGIYEIPSSGGEVFLFLQGGPTNISPSGLAADLAGNLYVADIQNHDLLEIAASPYFFRTVTTLLPQFSYFEQFVATDKSSNLYLYDGSTGGLIKRDVADPPSLSFAATAVNGASATQTLAVNSIGNAALVFTNVSPSSTNFSLTGSSCSSTTQLSAGTSCNLVVAFTPVAPASGTVDGSVVLTDNNLNAAPSTTQTIPLSGTAVEVLTLTPTSLTNATVGTMYDAALSASGGAASDTYTYAVTVGALPAGITLSRAGMLSGTPTSDGSFSFTVTATDTVTTTLMGTQAYSLTVNGPTLSLTPATGTFTGTAETAFSQAFTASGGTSPYRYALTVSAGTLPAGLSFSTTTGVLSGTPTTAATITFAVMATDNSTGTGAPFSVSASYTLTVGSPTITLTPTTLPSPTIEVPYSQTISANGGASPYTYSIGTGALPAGLTLSASGVLSGTATAAGPFFFTVKAVDTNGFTATQSYSFTIATPTITLMPASGTKLTGTAETAFSQTFTASGDTSPYSYSISAGALPAGLTLSISGVLSGTATASGTFSFTITAKDSSTGTGSPFTGTGSFTLTVGSPTITLTPATLPAPTIEAAYSETLSASGGTSPYTYSISASALPAGLTLNSTTGVLSGTATAAGPFTFTVTAKDTNSLTAAQSYSFTIAAPTITLTPATLPAPTIEAAYSQTLSASGGLAPYRYSISTGALPAGLTLNSTTGVLSGTATAAGPFTFTVTAKDTNSLTAAQSYSFTIAAPTITLTPASLPAPTVGVAYSETLNASGGTAPYTYSISAGVLPAGFTLNSTTGAIFGTATVGGTFSFTVTAKDTNSFTGTQAYSITVAKQASQTAVSASPSAATPVQTVTLTAVVSATAAGTSVVPTGTVTFLDNGTQVGTATLSGGTATLVVPSLPAAATAVVTATYAGDGNFLASTSSNSATVVVAPFDFTFTNTGTAAYTAAPGAVATYNFALAPLHGSYPGAVSFSVTGLPTGATASFTPSTVAVGGGATPVVMTVQTAEAIAHNSNRPFGRGIVLALLFLPLLSKRRVREKLRSRMLLLVLLMAGLTATLTGCGSHNSFLLQSPQTYTLTVTATSGTLQQSQTVTLIVQ